MLAVPFWRRVWRLVHLVPVPLVRVTVAPEVETPLLLKFLWSDPVRVTEDSATLQCVVPNVRLNDTLPDTRVRCCGDVVALKPLADAVNVAVVLEPSVPVSAVPDVAHVDDIALPLVAGDPLKADVPDAPHVAVSVTVPNVKLKDAEETWAVVVTAPAVPAPRRATPPSGSRTADPIPASLSNLDCMLFPFMVAVYVEDG